MLNCRSLVGRLLTVLAILALSLLYMGSRSATAQSQLALSVVGGPDFLVEQARPTDPDVISFLAGDRDPLVIQGTNSSDDDSSAAFKNPTIRPLTDERARVGYPSRSAMREGFGATAEPR